MLKVNLWWRRLHRYGAILCAVPLLLVIVTGLLLQLKKELPWVQPTTQKAPSSELNLTWDEILAVAQTDAQAKIATWDDVDRLDVRPGKGIVKVRTRSGWELQLATASGEILSSQPRRSDWIESLHDGSYFSDNAKLYVFFANGLVLLGLWVSGMYLWWLPIGARRRKQKRLRGK